MAYAVGVTVRLRPQDRKIDLTHVAVQIRGMGSHKNAYDATFFIDINAFESIAPAAELRKIGIEPCGKRDYELASGEVQECEYAFVELRFLDEITVTRLFFGQTRSKRRRVYRRHRKSDDNKAFCAPLEKIRRNSYR
jgi:hypothetical protein